MGWAKIGLAFGVGVATGVVVPVWMLVAALNFAKELDARKWEG